MDPLESKSTGNSPARIALCITELEPGGAERCLVELATRLDRAKFEPVVYCLGSRPAGNPTSLADRLEEAGIAVHCFGARGLGDVRPLYSSLREQMKEDVPRLVQTFLFHANVLGALAARRAGVPHVVSGIRVAEHSAGWHLRLARFGDRWVDRHVCVSQAVRDFSADRGRLPSEKLVVIPNGVDVARFANARPAPPTSLGRTGSRRLMACVGRLDEQKGLDWMLEALPDVFAEVPGVELVLVGDGPLRERLETLAAKLHIAHRVLFVGYRDDVPEILAASELVVLPSRWEGMPNAVLEAMAGGRPVVATDVAGVREALGDAADEQVVPLGNSAEFVRRIVAILGDNTLAARLGQANQARVREDFTYAAMVSAYERLYAGLLGGAA